MAKLRAFREIQYPTLPLYGSASSDPLNTDLRLLVTPRRATLYVDRVHLLDVAWTFDEKLGGWRMSWEPVAEVPLGR
ncbi:hypothetical protein [Streptomyces nigrescens]|uniref:Uncharacterized protein n=1 Tax=Streptomyces nigrescens TaxID=1920 RepID=A0ABY7J1T3_STRNI|nr:hypothetical protein [Streptomyces nigrescens]WAU04099.1 hypothetical protein STRNI_002333 [Streptomyces nigrescens]